MKDKRTIFKHLVSLFVVAMLVPMVTTVSAQTTASHEAPLLTEMVSKGLLPPVDKRLPQDPKVVKPLHEVGHYGGTANIYQLGYTFEVMQLMGVSTPFTQDVNAQPGLPHLFTGYEVNKDLTEY